MSGKLSLLKSHLNRFAHTTRRISQFQKHYAPIVLEMPALSPTMEEGSIVKWNIKVGDQIEIGDALCEVETDKAVVTVESSDEGTLAKILKQEGSKNIKLSVPIAIIAEDGEDLAEAASFVPKDPVDTQENSDQQTEIVDSAPNESSDSPTSVFNPILSLSPAVRQAVEWYNIKPSLVTPSGKNGRLLKGDVLKYIAENSLTKQNVELKSTPKTETSSEQVKVLPEKNVSTPKTESPQAFNPRTKVKYEDIEMSNVRKIIAQRLTESKQQIPHSYNSISCNVDSIVQLRSQLKQKGTKLSMNDFVVKAAGLALQQNKQVNSVWNNKGAVEESASSDISVAVATPGGLITPIVKSVESKGLDEISSETKSLATRARDGKLRPEEFQGGSFTISNLGMFGISEFTAVINPPQTCIMAVGTTKKKIKVKSSPEDDDTPSEQPELEVKNEMTVTLSSDSRVVNNEEASVFLECFKSHIEDPISMFMK